MAHAKKDKIWGDAIRRAVAREVEIEEAGIKRKVQWINVLADQLVRAASEGDMVAMKEVGERLDGKPHQSIDMTVTTNDLSDEEIDAEIASLRAAIDAAGPARRKGPDAGTPPGEGRPH